MPLLTECFELCVLRLAPLLFFWTLLALRLPRLLRPAPYSTSKPATSLTIPPADAANNACTDAIASSSPCSSSEVLRPPRLSPLTLAKLAVLGPLFLVLLVEIGALVRFGGSDGRLALASVLVPALEALTCVC